MGFLRTILQMRLACPAEIAWIDANETYQHPGSFPELGREGIVFSIASDPPSRLPRVSISLCTSIGSEMSNDTLLMIPVERLSMRMYEFFPENAEPYIFLRLDLARTPDSLILGTRIKSEIESSFSAFWSLMGTKSIRLRLPHLRTTIMELSSLLNQLRNTYPTPLLDSSIHRDGVSGTKRNRELSHYGINNMSSASSHPSGNRPMPSHQQVIRASSPVEDINQSSSPCEHTTDQKSECSRKRGASRSPPPPPTRTSPRRATSKKSTQETVSPGPKDGRRRSKRRATGERPIHTENSNTQRVLRPRRLRGSTSR